jgi:hypothetical protein
MSDRYSVELLANGLIRIFCRASKTSGLYRPGGEYKSGDLRLPKIMAAALMS